MGDKGEFTIFFKQKIEPFVAVAVLIMLILLVLGQVREYKITKEINENCGWGEEKYYCYCDKDRVMEMELELNAPGWIDDMSELQDVKVDR